MVGCCDCVSACAKSTALRCDHARRLVEMFYRGAKVNKAMLRHCQTHARRRTALCLTNVFDRYIIYELRSIYKYIVYIYRLSYILIILYIYIFVFHCALGTTRPLALPDRRTTLGSYVYRPGRERTSTRRSDAAVEYYCICLKF